MNEILIEVNNVSKRFCKDLKRSMRYGFMDSLRAIAGKDATVTDLRKDEFWAVKDVSFQLKRGECLGLIGHNGAGKSTLLKMLNGLINPDQGRIVMRGRIGALIELGAGFNPILTGRENIYNNGAVLGFTRKEIDAKVEEIIDFAEIREFIDAPVQNYSSGMRVRLGFAVAAQMEPDILLIDEVLAVGDIGFTIKCLTRIAELLKSCAVIFVSHSMPQVGKICTSAMMLKHGVTILNTNNISNVIQTYYSEFNTEKENIHGNGKAKVYNAKLISQKRTQISYDYAENISLSFDLDVDKSISKFVIYISFINLEIRSVALVSNVETELPINDGMIHNYSFDFNNYLAPGKYTITIEVVEMVDNNTNNIGEYLITHSNIIDFISNGGKIATYCPVQLPCKWSLI